jgi:hypothetical protein
VPCFYRGLILKTTKTIIMKTIKNFAYNVATLMAVILVCFLEMVGVDTSVENDLNDQ